MIKKILIGLAAIVAVFLIVAATRACQLRVERGPRGFAGCTIRACQRSPQVRVWNPFLT
jgi:hypothetical protein